MVVGALLIGIQAAGRPTLRVSSDLEYVCGRLVIV